MPSEALVLIALMAAVVLWLLCRFIAAFARSLRQLSNPGEPGDPARDTGATPGSTSHTDSVHDLLYAEATAVRDLLAGEIDADTYRARMHYLAARRAPAEDPRTHPR